MTKEEKKSLLQDTIKIIKNDIKQFEIMGFDTLVTVRKSQLKRYEALANEPI